MKAFLDRIDTFLGLYDRHVKALEEGNARDKERDAVQKELLSRYAEGVEHIATTTSAQTEISKRTAKQFERSNDILEQSIPPRYGDDG